MSANIALYFGWCILFAVIAGNFVQGIPFFILTVINSIAAYQMLIPRRINGDDK